jgi:hypothetical protein
VDKFTNTQTFFEHNPQLSFVTHWSLKMSSLLGQGKDYFELVKSIGESKSKQEEDRIIAEEVGGHSVCHPLICLTLLVLGCILKEGD